jgi:hypothetical protein
MEETRHINSPEVLSNITCAYCGEDLSAETEDTEHVVGRRFVPKGSLDGAWNIILKACKRCNREKGDLEDDISAITMQPTVAGQFHPLSGPSVVQEAERKRRRSRSRHTGKVVADSHERFTHTFHSPQVAMSFSFVGPPRIAETRIVALARLQIIGMMYRLTYDEHEQRGKFIEGEFRPLRSALRTDWGNAVHRTFMEEVSQWEDNLVGYTADGNFQVAIRQLLTPA